MGVRAGITWGLIFATVSSLYALGARVLRGPDSLASGNLTLVEVIALYYFGGLAGGVILGTFHSLVKSRASAAVLGVFSFLPFAIAVAIVAGWGPPFDWSWIGGAVIATLFVGGGSGYMFWEDA